MFGRGLRVGRLAVVGGRQGSYGLGLRGAELSFGGGGVGGVGGVHPPRQT